MVLIPIDGRFRNRDEDTPPTVPPHLRERGWLDYEREVALGVYSELARVLSRLAKDRGSKQVHDTRVTLRRWEAVWAVLEKDGWNEPKYWKKVGKKLRQLHKLLGSLRDWDVNLEVAETYDLPGPVISRFKKERSKVSTKVEARLKKLKIKKLLKRLLSFLEQRPISLTFQIRDSEIINQSAYSHLEPMLVEQEDTTRALEAHAQTIEELHELRLAIKGWRYLLTDYFGLTNLQLVKTQQMLGKLNDLSRVLALLTDEKTSRKLKPEAVTALKQQQLKVIREFEKLRKQFPYGLRPSVTAQPVEL